MLVRKLVSVMTSPCSWRGLHPPSLELWYDGSVNVKATTLLPVILLATAVSANGEPGFDPKHERDYNIFNPANQYRSAA